MSEIEYSIKKYVADIYLERASSTCIPRCNCIGYLIAGIKNEVGELYGVIKKAQREEDVRALPSSFYDKAYKELGDCFWYAVMALGRFEFIKLIIDDERMLRLAKENVYSFPAVSADNFFIEDVCLMYGLTKDEYLAGNSGFNNKHVLPCIFDIEDILDEVIGICSTMSSKSVVHSSIHSTGKKIVNIFSRLIAVNKILIDNDDRGFDIFHAFELNSSKLKIRHDNNMITGSGDDREQDVKKESASDSSGNLVKKLLYS